MKPANVASQLDSAFALHREGNLAAAEVAYRAVLNAEPDNFDSLHLMGVIVAQRGDLTAGVALIERALARRPIFGDAHFSLGNVLVRCSRFAAAERHFRQAVAVQPQNADAVNNLGGALLRLDRYGEAEACFRKALSIDPHLATALTNLGALAEMHGRSAEAITLYDRVLAIDPKNAPVRYQRACALLTSGRLAEGWDEAHWRFRSSRAWSMIGRFDLPYWRGEALAGQSIVVWTEQGPGDEMLIASMVPDVIARAARVALVCSPRMAPLFRRAFPCAEVLDADAAAGRPEIWKSFAVQASMSELGRWLRPEMASFPKRGCYLTADPARVHALRTKYLAGGRTPLIGISWESGSVTAPSEKSIPLVRWQELLKTPATFVSLQYGDCQGELDGASDATGVRIIADGGIDPVKDMDGFAAQVAAMDLVISVSNTTVHMAGALGRPIWAFIPSNQGRLWYWFLEREDSPWYSSARLFRQLEPGIWDHPLAAAREALRQWQAGFAR